jgi:hypothetical protein
VQAIRYTIGHLLALVFLLHIVSCGKQGGYTSAYVDKVAQDPSYRMGKWYSVTDSGSIPGYNHNTRLDTIWFISDSLAGWSGFGGNPYVYWPTYFAGPYNIVYVASNPLDTTQKDTVLHQCGMTTVGDTFVIYWLIPLGNEVLAEHYIKMKS